MNIKMATPHTQQAQSISLIPLNKVLMGDCIEVMSTLPEKSIDLIFADPPYNLQLQNELRRPNMTLVEGVDDEWDKFSDFAAYDKFTRDWLSQCRRVLKDDGTIWVIGSYHNIYRIGAIMMDMDFWMLNDVVWQKTNPMPQFRGVRFTNAHETLLWCKKSKNQKKYTFNYQQMKQLNDEKQMRSDWEIALCTGQERLKLNGKKLHSTQKPEALLYRVLLSSSNVGDTILDPFFGTGTTGAVAKKLHRHWLGIERDPLYARAAQERIDNVVPPLFATEVFASQSKRTQPRIPFGTLLETGLLEIGTTLYFAKPNKAFNPENVPTALVRPDGSLKAGEQEGSIHGLGAKIGNLPTCNGWEHWHYQDKDGVFQPIDKLREFLRLQKLSVNE